MDNQKQQKSSKNRSYLRGTEINPYTTTIIQPLENIAIDPILKFSSVTAKSKMLQGFTASQMNLFKKADGLMTREQFQKKNDNVHGNRTKISDMTEMGLLKEFKRRQKLEEKYQKYLFGMLKESTVILDKDTIASTLRKKEILVHKAPKGGIKGRKVGTDNNQPEDGKPKKPVIQVVSKGKIIADRYKAASALSGKWDTLEETRLNILIRMKTLQGYYEMYKKLKADNQELLSEYQEKSKNTIQKSRDVIEAIDELEKQANTIKNTIKQKKREPQIDYLRTEREWRQNIRAVHENLDEVIEKLNSCEKELKDLEPFQHESEKLYIEKREELDTILKLNEIAIQTLKSKNTEEEKQIVKKEMQLLENMSNKTDKLLTESDLELLNTLQATREILDKELESHKIMQETLKKEIEILQNKFIQDDLNGVQEELKSVELSSPSNEINSSQNEITASA